MWHRHPGLVGGQVADSREHGSGGMDPGLVVGDVTDVDIVGNVFWMCGTNGVVISNATRLSVRVRQNTSCANGLSGYVCDSYARFGQEWVGNIGCGNGGLGINWLRAGAATIVCNDWFGNRQGDSGGRPRST